MRTIKLGKMYHFNSLASIYMTWIIKGRTSKKGLLYPKQRIQMTIITSRLIYLPNTSDMLMTKMVMHNSAILEG